MNAVWVLLPLKGFAQAKQRLGDVLTVEQRSALFAATVENLLVELSKTDAIAGVAIVSSEPQVASLAQRFNATLLPEPEHTTGLNEAITWGLTELQAVASHVLVLHADLPLATASDIDRAASYAKDQQITLLPDWQRNGTNGMLTPLPCPITFAYGENSFTKHSQLATEAGVKFDVIEQSSLAFDVDTPQDLALLTALANNHTLAVDIQTLLSGFGEVVTGLPAPSDPTIKTITARLGL